MWTILEGMSWRRMIVAAALAWWPARAQPAAPVALAVEDRVDPIGIDDTTPEFSWTVAPRDGQSAYQILVASSAEKLARNIGDKWNSGKVRSSMVAFVTYAGAPLRSREICHWKVRAWNQKGAPSPYAAPANFEMGLLANADWSAQWIWRGSEEPDDYSYFRRVVKLDAQKIARARAYVSAMHRYELYVNGRLVAKGPNFASPEYQYYQTLPLEPFLASGRDNVIGLLGHWYGAGQGRPAGRRGMLFQAVVEYADGTSTVVDSDRSWKTRRGEWIAGKRYRNGEGIPAESIDARLHPAGWHSSGFDERDWASATELGRHPTPPWTGTLRAQETTIAEYEMAPVTVRPLGPRRYVADFGKVYAGMPKIAFRGGKAGDAVDIAAGYRLAPDGSVTSFAQSTDMTYRYILRGGEETFQPYWYLGFRYVEVSNAPHAPDARSLRLMVRHHKVDPGRSSFESSDDTLNGVWDLAKRSVMLGSQEQFVDTPTREQAQFTYDAYLTGMAQVKLFGDRDLSQQGLREFAQSQEKFHGATGKVNAVYPNGDGARDIPDWTQSWIFWAWEYYRETGDRELVEDLFSNLVRAAEWVKSTENPQTGLVDLGSSSGYAGGIVDWPDRYDYDMTTTQRTVMSVNAWLDYTCIVRLAALLGRIDVAKRFQGYADAILRQIQERLWDGGRKAYIDGLYAGGGRSPSASQQANMMLLALDLARGDRQRGAMEAVQRAGHRTSPVLAQFLVRAYGEHDADDALYEYLLNPRGRNWASTLADGGTFTYEAWEGRRRDASTSESHPFTAYGAVVALQEYVLGVQPLEPQYARLRVRPHPGPLRFARGRIPTPRGPLSVAWERDPAGGFRLKVALPAGARTDLYVPREDGAGTRLTVNGGAREGKAAGRYVLLENLAPGAYDVYRLPSGRPKQ